MKFAFQKVLDILYQNYAEFYLRKDYNNSLIRKIGTEKKKEEKKKNF